MCNLSLGVWDTHFLFKKDEVIIELHVHVIFEDFG
jgi:hypothetical protein